MDGQRQLTPPQGAAHRGKAGGGDLLEDRHHEAQRAALGCPAASPGRSRPAGIAQLGVEGRLASDMVKDSVWTHRRAKSGEPSGVQASALVRRKTTAFSRWRCSTISSGLLNRVGIEQLDQHPEPEMVALVRRGRQQEQVAGMVPQRLASL